jgi:hypothetical protein
VRDRWWFLLFISFTALEVAMVAVSSWKIAAATGAAYVALAGSLLVAQRAGRVKNPR